MVGTSALNIGSYYSRVVIHNREPDLCEECGSPLVDGFCGSCGTGYAAGASPVGAAPLERRELSRVLGRSVGARAHGSYSLSMQQKPGMAPLRREIDLLVEQFSASPELKASVKQGAEKLAVKIMDEFGPIRAAIASVSQEFLRRGRSMAEVSSRIARVHPGMDRLKDLVMEVRPSRGPEEVRVLVDGMERPFTFTGRSLYLRLRVPLFASDDGRLLELKGAELTVRGRHPKRLSRLGSSEFQVKADESFELFKVLAEARLAGLPVDGGNPVAPLKYSIPKLPLTDLLLRESGHFLEVSREYTRRLSEKVADGGGRSPRKLAEETLFEVCENTVPAYLSEMIIRKHHLKPSGMRSLVVKAEMARWQG